MKSNFEDRLMEEQADMVDICLMIEREWFEQLNKTIKHKKRTPLKASVFYAIRANGARGRATA